jgi:hypothetical protein
MSTLQAIIFGMLLVLTPSALFLTLGALAGRQIVATRLA